ncbi:hypothetical protein FGG08_002006 [Glutinoglossum americanum]|uniref:Uncharacterized protein n=1 Tax=Glutinoglossum americanum TaxID=1670608 RepID=A0A9P8L5W6_9PEZI|nr:hypothetical protein FGG08_002006 [Glutinoglossum americanum]
MAATSNSAKPLTFSTPSEKKSMNGKFQLPTLAPLNFSLTDGTNIPPPPESPVAETKPDIKVTPLAKSAPPTPQQQKQQQDGLPETPASPTSTSTNGDRASSIRRFLSLKSLNSTYNNHPPTFGSSDISRPQSPSAKSSASTLGKKSWFMRVRKTEPSLVEGKGAVANGSPPEKKGPPPPTLPEVRTETGSLFGDEDVFGKIK